MSHQMGTRPQDPRSIPQLVEDAMADARAIVEHERALAQAELKKSAVQGGIVAGLAVAALTLLWFSGFAVVITIAEAFVEAGLVRWAAYLVTVGIYVLLAVVLLGVAALIGRRIGGPRTTIELGRQTVADVRERLQHLGRPGSAGRQPTAQAPTSTGPPPSTPAGSASVSAASSSRAVRA
jgi:hypothetical protein